MIKDIKNIAGVSSFIITARVVGLLLSLVWMILITRNIEIHYVGQLIFGISLSNLLAIFISLNMGAVAIKFIPSYITDDKTKHIKGYVKSGNYLVITIAFVTTILITCLYLWRSSITSEIIPIYILISLLSSPLLGWIQLQANYIRAFDKVLLSVIPTFLLQPIIMLMLLWIGIESNLITSGKQLMIVYFATLVVVFIVQHSMFKNTFTQITATKADYSELTRWLIQALQLLVPILFIQNAAQTIVVFSSGVLTEGEIAVSGVILRIMSLILFSVSTITMATSPKLSRAVHSNNGIEVTRILTISNLTKIILVVLGYLAVLWFGKYLLGFFGDQYIIGHKALLILTLVPIVTVIFGPVVLFVTFLNLHLHSLVVFLITVVLLAALIIKLGAEYGVEGQAYAVFITWFFWNACLYTIIRTKTGYDISIFSLFNKKLDTDN